MAVSALVSLDGQTELIVLGTELKILRDETGGLTIEDVVYHKNDKAFEVSQDEIPNLGYSRSTYWIWVDLGASYDAQKMKWVLELSNQLVFWVDLYVTDLENPCIAAQNCLFKPHQARSIVHGNNIFYLNPTASQRLYLKVQPEDIMKIPLLLWSNTAFDQKVEDVSFFGGVFLGVLIVMALYNLFLFVSVRDFSYLYFVAFIVCYIVALDAGNRLLWQVFPWWVNEIMPLSLSLIGLSLILFSRSYLNSGKTLIRFDTILKLFLIGSIGLILFSFLSRIDTAMRVSRIFLIFEYLAILSAGGLALSRGYRAAIYFMIAVVPILFGFIVSGLSNFGLISITAFTTQAPSMGVIAGIVLFSFGLGDKINLERKMKFAA